MTDRSHRRMRRSCWTAATFLLVAGMATSAIGATPPDRFNLAHGDLRIELSAPRAGIMRVRVGRTDLPEDASWAVPAEVRTRRIPLAVAEHVRTVDVTAGGLTATIDRTTLSLSIRDAAGHVVLADAAAPVFTSSGFSLREAMPADAHYFGLGDKTGRLDRRGGVYTMWNSDTPDFTPSTDPIYKSIPFLIGTDASGRTTGLFLDNGWRTVFDLGKTERDTMRITAEGGPLDYYVMAAATPVEAIADYAFITGKPPLPPRWTLGFQQSHWGYLTQAEVEGVAKRLRTDRIPADALWLDIDYQDRNRPFTVDKRTFPDLKGLVDTLAAEQLHLVTITDLHIAAAPDQGYRPYDTGIAGDVFVHGPDGKPFIGPVWPGPALFPDFSRAKVRLWWGEQYRDLVGMGVAGFWNDMNEPSVFDRADKTMPLDNIHRIDEPGFRARDATHAEMHNVFGMLNTRATYEGVLALRPNARPFVMTRATSAGGQRYAATWTGDNTSSWAHLSLSTTQLVSLGLSGFAYAGADIGGFMGPPPSADLLTRWIEVGAFNPIFRDHYQKDKAPQEPWVHGPEHLAIRRHYIEERYRLLPYLYALADENSRTGLPLMRPVFLHYPAVLGDGEHLGGTEAEFMMGEDLLIAPPAIWESPAPYSITLPGIGWYDYWTGLPVPVAHVVEKPELDRLPVYVRPGAIIPRQPLTQSTVERPNGPLELAVYPGEGADCHGMLYLDDGDSQAYRKGDFLRQVVRCSATGIQFGAREGRFPPWWNEIAITIHGWKGNAPRVMIADRALPTQVDRTSQTLRFSLPDQAQAVSIAYR